MDVIVTDKDGKVIKTIPSKYLQKFLDNGWTCDNMPEITDEFPIEKHRGRPRNGLKRL
jgi:hypothetical protein